MKPEERVKIDDCGSLHVWTGSKHGWLYIACPVPEWKLKRLTDAFADAEADELERCCDAIRAACGGCEGAGKVWDKDGRASECHYCKGPIAAIRKPPAESEAAEDNSPEAICDILSLADCVVPLTIVAAWAEQDRKLAGNWAAAIILLASDHDDVTIPPEPLCVKGYTDASMTESEVPE